MYICVLLRLEHCAPNWPLSPYIFRDQFRAGEAFAQKTSNSKEIGVISQILCATSPNATQFYDIKLIRVAERGSARFESGKRGPTVRRVWLIVVALKRGEMET